MRIMFLKKKVEVSKVDKTLGTEPFKKLKVDFKSLNLTINAGDHFEIHYNGPEDNEPELQQNEDQLILKQISTKSHDFQWQKGIFKIEFSQGEGKVTVTVPKDQEIEEVEVECKSGNVAVDGVKLKKADLETLSGNLRVQNSKLSDVSLLLVSGNLNIKQTEIIQGIAHLTSGNFTMKQSRVVQDMKVKTVSGDNYVKETQVDRCEAQTVNGDVSIANKKNHVDDGSELFLSTVSGDNRVE